jgi:hypothetical protein
MLVCTICKMEIETLDGFKVVCISNRETTVLDHDGIAHCFRTVANTAGNSDNAIRVNHKRWHERRNIANPDCPLCLRNESPIPQ